MRLAIVGSRSFSELQMVVEFVDGLDASTEIVSGGARGVDRTAALAASSRGLQVTEIRPDWRLGKRAALIRNEQIVAYCDGLVAFWDGRSRGTAFTISLAKKHRKLREVFRISGSGLVRYCERG